jgi:hypothetical protein
MSEKDKAYSPQVRFTYNPFNSNNSGTNTANNKKSGPQPTFFYNPWKQDNKAAPKPKPKGTFTYNRPKGASGSADVMERRIQANKAGKPLYGRDQGQPERPWWEDIEAFGGGGGGGGSARAYSDAQIAAAQARLQAIYGRFADDIAAQEAAIGQTYDTAGTSLGGIYDTSVGNINRAYDAARAAQTQQLLNLGMTEQTPVQSFGNQTAATTSLQNLRAAVLAQNEASRKASITNQRLASEAARRQGTESAAQLAAEMQAAMVSTGGGGGGGGGGLTPYQAANLRMRGEENEFNRQRAAEEFNLKSQPKPTVNRQAILDQISRNPDTANLSNSEKIALANFMAGG